MSVVNDTHYVPLQDVEEQLPQAVFYSLCVITPLTMLVAAFLNFEEIVELGMRLGLGGLSPLLPLVVIVYELASTTLFFFIPKVLKWMRISALVGAILGLVLTVVLANVNVAISDGALEVSLKLKMAVPAIASLVSAAFLHMFVLAYHARKPRKSAPALTSTEVPLSRKPVLPEVPPEAAEPEELRKPEAGGSAPPEGPEDNTEPVPDPNVRPVPDPDAEDPKLPLNLRQALAEVRAARNTGHLRPSGKRMQSTYGGVGEKQWRNLLRKAGETLDAEMDLISA